MDCSLSNLAWIEDTKVSHQQCTILCRNMWWSIGCNHHILYQHELLFGSLKTSQHHLMLWNEFGAIICNSAHRINRVKDFLFENVSVPPSRPSTDLHSLLSLSLSHSAIVSDLINDVILELFESEISILLCQNGRIAANHYRCTRPSHKARTHVFGNVQFVGFSCQHDCHTPCAKKLGLDECLNGTFDIVASVQKLA